MGFNGDIIGYLTDMIQWCVINLSKYMLSQNYYVQCFKYTGAVSDESSVSTMISELYPL